jgi:hypothetical protein
VTGLTGATGAVGVTGATGAVGAKGSEFEAIATFTSGAEYVPQGRSCLGYTELLGKGAAGVCPGSTTGYSPSIFVAGPAPAGGETVSRLAADTSASLTGPENVIVKVIDNTTNVVLEKCEVTAANKNHCEEPAVGGHAAALANIEVELEVSGPNAARGQWRVRFRY